MHCGWKPEDVFLEIISTFCVYGQTGFVQISGMCLSLSSKTKACARRDFFDSKQYRFCPHAVPQSTQNKSCSVELQRQDGKKEISICDSIVSWNGRKYKKKTISVFRKALCENLSETDLSLFLCLKLTNLSSMHILVSLKNTYFTLFKDKHHKSS